MVRCDINRRAANGRAVVTPTAAVLIVSMLVGACAAKRTDVTLTPCVADWGAVEALGAGQLVEVESRQGVQAIGRVSEVTSSELHVVGASGGTRVARRADVRQVALIVEGKADSSRNGALIGALIGTGYAAGVMIYIAGGDDRQGSGSAAASVIAGAAMGAGIGALIDRLRVGRATQVIYRAYER